MPEPTDWRKHAACRDEDPELFFPVGASGPALLQVEQAKAVCRRCSVTDECHTWALETEASDGIWAGLTERERRELLRRRELSNGVPAPDAVVRLAASTAKTRRPARANTGAASPQDHAAEILAMLSQQPRPTFTQIAKKIGAKPGAVKKWWCRYLARVEREQGYAARWALEHQHREQPPVIERWLPYKDSGLSVAKIAKRIGSSTNGLYAAIARARAAGDPRVPAATGSNQYTASKAVA